MMIFISIIIAFHITCTFTNNNILTGYDMFLFLKGIKCIITILDRIQQSISDLCRNLVWCDLHSASLTFIMVIPLQRGKRLFNPSLKNNKMSIASHLFNDQHENRHVNRK